MIVIYSEKRRGQKKEDRRQKTGWRVGKAEG